MSASDREKRDDIGEIPALEITLLRLPAPRQVQAIEFEFLRSSLRHCLRAQSYWATLCYRPPSTFFGSSTLLRCRARALANRGDERVEAAILTFLISWTIILSGHSVARASPPFDPETGHAPPR